MEAAAAVPCASATFGVSASGEWVKALCFDNIRRACGSDAFDEGDESEGKKEGKRGVPWQCPNFMWVNVWNNDIKALSMRMAPRTLYLDCSNNDIRSLDTLQGGQNLVYLDASSNDIGKKGRAGLPPPGSLLMPALEGLNLANNDLGNVPDNGMDWCPNVRAVSLNNNDLKTFTDSPNWGQLQFLNLANNDLRAVPSLARSPYLRQLYLEKNKLADDSVPAICRLIDIHPYLIRLKLGHNRFSKGAIQAIIAHGQMRNPYLFHDGAQLNFANDFSTPMSTYGANGGGARTADATTCWVVPMPAGAPPPFAEAFPVVDGACVNT